MTTQQQWTDRKNAIEDWAMARETFTAYEGAKAFGISERVFKIALRSIRRGHDGQAGAIVFDYRLNCYVVTGTYAEARAGVGQSTRGLNEQLRTLTAQVRSVAAGTPEDSADYLIVDTLATNLARAREDMDRMVRFVKVKDRV